MWENGECRSPPLLATKHPTSDSDSRGAFLCPDVIFLFKMLAHLHSFSVTSI